MKDTMKCILSESLSGDRCITVYETNDKQYAHDCFDGSDREWEEVVKESSVGDLDQQMGMFYIVSSGLSGCYMRDNVSVYGCRKDALRAARNEIKRDIEESEESE